MLNASIVCRCLLHTIFLLLVRIFRSFSFVVGGDIEVFSGKCHVIRRDRVVIMQALLELDIFIGQENS